MVCGCVQCLFCLISNEYLILSKVYAVVCSVVFTTCLLFVLHTTLWIRVMHFYTCTVCVLHANYTRVVPVYFRAVLYLSAKNIPQPSKTTTTTTTTTTTVLPPIRIKKIPWLFTDHVWCDWVNKAYSLEFTIASVSFAGLFRCLLILWRKTFPRTTAD